MTEPSTHSSVYSENTELPKTSLTEYKRKKPQAPSQASRVFTEALHLTAAGSAGREGIIFFFICIILSFQKKI